MHLPIPLYAEDVTQGQFLSGIQQNSEFSSLRVVAIPRLKNTVGTIICPELKGE